MKVNTHLIVTRYLRSRTTDHRLHIILDCECGGANKPRMKPRIDDEEEEVPIKRRGPYRTKKYGCPFKLKGEQMVTCKNWKLFVHDGMHNYAANLTEEQLIQTGQFRKSHVPPHNILRFF
ncbi:hypothetical protein M9H77_04543 [Catharanthus roseus]|uniref:Uncharacterized protein n=1 Tax=Catharanthus roseus TaxID=4058 RepID=A0ACC0CEG1_CATRO|nr:hypothetical protein M9H77_04543 [Catharanthus roseus]